MRQLYCELVEELSKGNDPVDKIKKRRNIYKMVTVAEVEAKKTTLEAEQATALEAAKVLTPATPEFDEAYSRYLAAKASIAKIPDEVAAAKLAENADAINVAAGQVADAIVQLVDGLKVAELIGKPVEALRFAKDAEGKTLVVFNPVTKVRSATTKGKKGAGRTVIVDPTGDKWSLTKFVLEHATDAEKATPEYRYPHSQVATKPKFEAFCAAHSLTGYVYTLPTAEEAEAEAS